MMDRFATIPQYINLVASLLVSLQVRTDLFLSFSLVREPKNLLGVVSC